MEELPGLLDGPPEIFRSNIFTFLQVNSLGSLATSCKKFKLLVNHYLWHKDFNHEFRIPIKYNAENKYSSQILAKALRLHVLKKRNVMLECTLAHNNTNESPLVEEPFCLSALYMRSKPKDIITELSASIIDRISAIITENQTTETPRLKTTVHLTTGVHSYDLSCFMRHQPDKSLALPQQLIKSPMRDFAIIELRINKRKAGHPLYLLDRLAEYKEMTVPYGHCLKSLTTLDISREVFYHRTSNRCLVDMFIKNLTSLEKLILRGEYPNEELTDIVQCCCNLKGLKNIKFPDMSVFPEVPLARLTTANVRVTLKK